MSERSDHKSQQPNHIYTKYMWINNINNHNNRNIYHHGRQDTLKFEWIMSRGHRFTFILWKWKRVDDILSIIIIIL